MTGETVVIEDGTATKEANAVANQAAVAAAAAVETAAELAAQSGRAAAAEIQDIKNKTDDELSGFEERLASWRQEMEQTQTNLHSETRAMITTLGEEIAKTKAETATALETLLARLTPSAQEMETDIPNTPVEPTKTEVHQENVGGNPDKETNKVPPKPKRTIRKI